MAFLATGSAIFYTFLGELLGTMVLIILGNGVVASAKFKNMFANGSKPNWVLITLGWGFAVLVGVIIANAFKAPGYINPAVTVYDYIHSLKRLNEAGAVGTGFGLLVLYILGQILGAMLGQVILNFINWNHIKDTATIDLKASSCTGPAYPNKFVQNFSYELVGTLVLIGSVLALGFGVYADNHLGAFPVTFVVVAIGMSIGSSTGYAINPARDLGPRIVFTLTQKLFLSKREQISSDYKYGLTVPVCAPLVGGIIMGLIGYATTL